MIYRDRRHAGASLAERLLTMRIENPLVLAIPRGGVPVAYEIAHELDAPLDLVLVRKLSVPWLPAADFGAIAPGAVHLDPQAVSRLGLSAADIEPIVVREQKELYRKKCHYENMRRPALVEGRTILLVDDGLATGVTAQAAIASLRKQHPRKIIFAAPVCAPASAAVVEELTEGLVCGAMPGPFATVGQWYRDFASVSDDDVLSLVRRAAAEHSHAAAGSWEAPQLSFGEEHP